MVLMIYKRKTNFLQNFQVFKSNYLKIIFLKLSVNCICTSILVNSWFYIVLKFCILNILQNLYLNTFKKFLLQDCCNIINNKYTNSKLNINY